MYVLIFLLSIVLANLSVMYFGPKSVPINAFILIGLDLTLRDKLHEQWHGRGLWWKMMCLVAASGVITYAINAGAGRIAIASVCAFCGAMLFDVVIYQWLFKTRFLVKANGSNVGSAVVDSLLFPTIAFGVFMPWIVLGQIVAKIGGGFVWSLVINKIHHGGKR